MASSPSASLHISLLILTSTSTGVSDRHNDYGSASKHDTAGVIPGHNITEAGHGHGESAGRPGEAKFDSHAFKEKDGFRDTHSEEANPQNGTKFKFEDHKEDSAREGKDVQVHSSDPSGERVDGNGHYFKESHDGVDVKDANGATDTVHKNSAGTQFHGMFQKHHAGPDNSDAHDSKVTHSGALDSQHQKEEHKDPNLHTMHETSSGKGTWSFNMVGNNALGDLAQESKNWPKQGQMSQTGKPGWGNSLPKNEGEMAEASKVDWGTSPHSKRQSDEMLVAKHKGSGAQHANPLLPEPLRILPPSLVEKRQSGPPVDSEGHYWHSGSPIEVAPKPEETPGHFWHSGSPIEVAPKPEETPSLIGEAPFKNRAAHPKDSRKVVPDCCKHNGKYSSQHPPSDENLVEKRASEPMDPISPAEKAKGPDSKAKHLIVGVNKYLDPSDDLDGKNMYSAPTTDEMAAEWRAHKHVPTRSEFDNTPTARVEVVPGGSRTFTPEQVAANAQLGNVSKGPSKKIKSLAAMGGPTVPHPPTEKRSDDGDEMPVRKPPLRLSDTTESKNLSPAERLDDVDELSVERPTMPPANSTKEEFDMHLRKNALLPDSGDELHIEARDNNGDDPVPAALASPGHPYLVGHAAANPNALDNVDAHVLPYHQEAPPTELAARSDGLNAYAESLQNNFEKVHEWKADDTSIYVLPTREHTSRKDDARLNTIQICSAVIMAVCLALCLGFLVWWVPRKVRARRSRKRAATAEMEQRDVELAELNEELDREVVEAAAGAKKDDKK